MPLWSPVPSPRLATSHDIGRGTFQIFLVSIRNLPNSRITRIIESIRRMPRRIPHRSDALDGRPAERYTTPLYFILEDKERIREEKKGSSKGNRRESTGPGGGAGARGRHQSEYADGRGRDGCRRGKLIKGNITRANISLSRPSTLACSIIPRMSLGCLHNVRTAMRLSPGYVLLCTLAVAHDKRYSRIAIIYFYVQSSGYFILIFYRIFLLNF